MRAILGFAAALAVAWGGYWFVGTHAIRQQLDQWLVQNASLARVQDYSISGFPNRFDVTFKGVQVQDEAREIAVSAPFFQVFAMTWKPWHLIAALPPTLRITYKNQVFDLAGQHMLGSILTQPSHSFSLGEARLDGNNLALKSQDGWAIRAEHMAAAVDAAAGPYAPRIGLRLRNITPPAGIAAQLDLPGKMDDLHLDARLTIAQSGAQSGTVTAVDLADASLIWGDFGLHARGQIARDALGFAAGDVTLTVQDWPKLPRILAGLGVISGDQIAVLAKGVAVLGPSAEVALRLSEGRIWMGPLAIGAAPIWPL